ncbi:MAG TPA: hypothetical protein VH371_03290 [Candidatus Limnocylindrales bacterium]|jgi:hypothetical protein
MRTYEGASRQNYEAVLRSLGAVLDQRGMREITVNESDDGFIVQGLALAPGEQRDWSDPEARIDKETFHLRDEDMSRFMDEAQTRRQGRQQGQAAAPGAGAADSGFYELALRVVGAYVDQQEPRDVFFFEQDHQFVMRLLMPTRAGLHHVLVEFTKDEIEAMIAAGQQGRGR